MSEYRKLMNSSPFRKFDQREFFCGWSAAFINIGITYPVYKMIFRQMLLGIQLKSAFLQLKSEGIWFLYRGVSPPLAQKTISLSLMFGVYDGVKKILLDTHKVDPYVSKIAAGCVAGTVEAVLMPFERIQTLLADSTYHAKFKNTPHAFRAIWSQYGFRELYRGLIPILYRNGPSNAVFFIMREEALEKLPKRNGAVNQIQQFTSGACIGAVVSTIFYPMNVVKVVIQSKLGGPFENMFHVFRVIYVDRGHSMKNLYKGVWPNAMRAFLSWGIMNAAYENMRRVVY